MYMKNRSPLVRLAAGKDSSCRIIASLCIIAKSQEILLKVTLNISVDQKLRFDIRSGPRCEPTSLVLVPARLLCPLIVRRVQPYPSAQHQFG